MLMPQKLFVSAALHFFKVVNTLAMDQCSGYVLPNIKLKRETKTFKHSLSGNMRMPDDIPPIPAALSRRSFVKRPLISLAVIGSSGIRPFVCKYIAVCGTVISALFGTGFRSFSKWRRKTSSLGLFLSPSLNSMFPFQFIEAQIALRSFFSSRTCHRVVGHYCGCGGCSVWQSEGAAQYVGQPVIEPGY